MGVSGPSDLYPCLLDSSHGEISGLVTILYYQLHIKPAKTAPLVISTLMVIIFTFLMGQPPPPSILLPIRCIGVLSPAGSKN